MNTKETKVVTLKAADAQPHDDLVECLEQLLKDAKAGDLQDLVAVGVCSGGDVLTVRMVQGDAPKFTMLGGMTRLVVELSNELNNQHSPQD